MDDKQFKPGEEVIVIGPTVWGQYIHQGQRGVVRQFAPYCFGGTIICMNSGDRHETYPDSSLKHWKSEEHLEEVTMPDKLSAQQKSHLKKPIQDRDMEGAILRQMSRSVAHPKESELVKRCDERWEDSDRKLWEYINTL